jgi:hypothetical protein
VVILLLTSCAAPKTIQDAVSAARDGDLVLVAPGNYRETVQLKTPNVVLRGTQRDGVIIDGEVRRANGIVVTAPAHPALQGFWVSYVTASNNGLFGIYAFDAKHGVIENSYASGEMFVLGNRFVGNPGTGLAIGSTEDLPPVDNRVLGNVLTGNGVDLAYTASSRTPGSGNCLQDNEIGTATPPQTAAFLSRTGLPLPRNSAPPGIPFTTVEVNVIAVPPSDFLAAQAGVRL